MKQEINETEINNKDMEEWFGIINYIKDTMAVHYEYPHLLSFTIHNGKIVFYKLERMSKRDYAEFDDADGVQMVSKSDNKYIG